MIKKLKLGDTFEFKWGKYEIINILNEHWENGERKYIVKFINTNYETTTCPSSIKTGAIRDPFYKHIAGIGCLGNASRRHFLYNRWRAMISRCYSEVDKSYKYYGNNGIYVCDDWHCFENYIKDVVKLEGYNEEKVKNKELNLDKDILSDVENKCYSPETCKWVTFIENNNTRSIRTVKYFEATRIIDDYKEISNVIIEFARKYNLDNNSINNCLNNRRKTHKGWKFSYIEDIPLVELNNKS